MAGERVTIHYHFDEGVWWADSPDLKLSAGDSDLAEAKSLAKGAVRLALGPDVAIVEWMPVPEPLRKVVSYGASASAEIQNWSTKRLSVDLVGPRSGD